MTIGQVEHRWRHLRESFSNQSLPNLKHRACHIYRKKKLSLWQYVFCASFCIYICVLVVTSSLFVELFQLVCRQHLSIGRRKLGGKKGKEKSLGQFFHPIRSNIYDSCSLRRGPIRMHPGRLHIQLETMRWRHGL